jgi:hypothetical protein
MPDQTREYDVVLFGATGFTGGLTAEYLARAAGSQTRWALAGRNRRKLAATRERTNIPDLPLLSADVTDPASLRAIAESAKVVITTVGPYIHYGEPLVAACAVAGTDYVDLTGEPEFVDLMWLRYHEQAERTERGSSTAVASIRSPTTSACCTRSTTCPRAFRSRSRASSEPAACSAAAPTTRPSTSWVVFARPARWPLSASGWSLARTTGGSGD